MTTQTPPDDSSREATSPVYQAHAFGQSIWLDNISRDLLLSGELRRWVENEGIRGVTSNPAIFEKAIAKSSDYDAAARAFVAQGAGDALDVFERLAVADIQLGCDVLRPVFDESEGRDGFVSLEVSPYLANDTEGTIAEARRLAKAVSRDNLMIKVPATPEGIPAIQQLISDGIHVNVTLLFAIDAYQAVHQAYISGLEARLDRGESVAGISSVASFFISRIDASVGQHIEAALEKETREDRRERLDALQAKVAIANAKLAYACFLEALAGDRWQRLEKAGAAPQRVLWASTGTKDPSLPKTLYVDELIGHHTVNTLPDATLDAFRREGSVRDALGSDPAPLKAEAQAVLSELDALGISLKEITDTLLTKGCALFSDAFDGLLLSVETKRQKLLGADLSSTEYALGSEYASDVADAQERWQHDRNTHRLWQGRAELFSDADEAAWMGWLELPDASPDVAIGAAAVRAAVRDHDSDTVVVIGMGGSSLWPDVLGQCFGPALQDESLRGAGRQRALQILDTTVPDSVTKSLDSLDLARTLFIVSSKSGSTLEPNALFEEAHRRVVDAVGPEAAGGHFVAITDPGSDLDQRARDQGFLGIAHGRPDVGGRFSALSPFGLLPAEAMGLDPEALQARARRMSAACAAFVSPERNPGVQLGITLATLAQRGRDKLSLTVTPELALFSDWIEQLVAESTGKNGQGIVPVAGEALGAPTRYGNDRVFVDLSLAGDAGQAERENRLSAIEAAGHPVVRIRIAEAADLVQEVFRWEIATAVVGAILGLNPFDQPDVEAAKVASRERIEARAGGQKNAEEKLAGFTTEGAALHVAPALAETAASAIEAADPDALFAALLESIEPGDTFIINAFLEDDATTRGPLAALRHAIGEKKRVATTLDFGPRYLHSTGQLQKGGPNRVVGIQLWQSASSRGTPPVPIPHLGGDFDSLAEAQAAGDLAVLAERGRRMLGIDVGADPAATLARLTGWARKALA